MDRNARRNAPLDEHVQIIDQDFMEGTYLAGCSCDWEAVPDFDTRADAEDAWENHCDVVFMEATGG